MRYFYVVLLTVEQIAFWESDNSSSG